MKNKCTKQSFTTLKAFGSFMNIFFFNRLHCHFSIEERREENIYSVVWYWTPSNGYTSWNTAEDDEIGKP